KATAATVLPRRAEPSAAERLARTQAALRGGLFCPLCPDITRLSPALQHATSCVSRAPHRAMPLHP
ncbi:hypothetical protein, partial [Xanthomonas sacchari]|uniref:hypothetical protein n=1 Tax=Xanthomonas sacchari TaxID=56458 RepID=UPI001F48BCCB